MNKFTPFFIKIVPFIVLLFIAIPACLPLIKPGFFPTQDFIHVARLYEMDKVLKDGNFPVRWSPDFRYGDPTFNFYAPLPFYLGSLIHSFNFTFLQTIKILFGLGFILSGITMYLLSKEFFGKVGGIVAASLYIYAPYHSVDVYVRGALSESLALVFFPLIFLGVYRLGQRITRGNFLLLSLALAGLFLTHNIMTVLFTPFILGWMCFWIFKKKELGVIKRYIAAILLGFSLSATFLLPAYFEKDFTQSSKMVTGYFDYRGHFVESKQLIIPSWGYGASLWGNEDGMSFQLGLVHLAVLGVSILLTVVFQRKYLSLIIFLILEFLFSLFMLHNKSTPIWTTFSLLAYTQFPWRFLGISIFFVSLISGFLGIFLKRKTAILLVPLIGFLILVNINYFRPESYYDDSVDAHYISQDVIGREDKVPKDYLPSWVKRIFLEKLESPHGTLGTVNIKNYVKKDLQTTFEADIKNNGEIEVPVTYFPGWKVWANGKEIKIEEPSENGLIRFKLPEGSYQIKVQLTDTFIRQLSNVLSLFALGFVILILFNKEVKF